MHHGGFLTCAFFHPDGTRIVTADHNQTTRVWDAMTGKALGEPIQGALWARFTPDGSRIFTVDKDGCANWWRSPRLKRSQEAIPGWLLEYAWAVGGLRFDSEGRITPFPILERLEILKQPRQGDDPWSRLARWLSLPAASRTLTPDSTLTRRLLAERERDIVPPTLTTLESSLNYDPVVPLAHVLLAEELLNQASADRTSHISQLTLRRAEELRIHGMSLLPGSDAGLWLRAAQSLRRQNDFLRSRAAVAKALQIAPGLPGAVRLLQELGVSGKTR
jgi:WD40 repeat protein